MFPNGTTGECASLTAAEREAVVKTTVANAGDRPVLAGIIDTALPDVVEHAERAASAGADAAVVTPPYFHAENRAGGNLAFLERVADESPLPVFVYDIPSCTGNPLAAADAVALADHPNVVGMKDSSGEFTDFCRVLRNTPDDFVVLQGFDALLLPSLRMGADGGVHALANAVPDAFDAMFRAAAADAGEVESGASDAARADRIHDAISELFDACLDVGFAPATKAALVERGVLDHATVRPPLQAADADAVSEALAGVLAVTE
ncbi:hypothetical protein JCM17823_09910 [Halorubrum gandharaense]